MINVKNMAFLTVWTSGKEDPFYEKGQSQYQTAENRPINVLFSEKCAFSGGYCYKYDYL